MDEIIRLVPIPGMSFVFCIFVFVFCICIFVFVFVFCGSAAGVEMTIRNNEAAFVLRGVERHSAITSAGAVSLFCLLSFVA